MSHATYIRGTQHHLEHVYCSGHWLCSKNNNGLCHTWEWVMGVSHGNESWEWVMGHVSGRAWYESCHSFSCVTWCMCHVTHSDVLRDPCVIRLILVCYTIDVFWCVASFMCYIIYVLHHLCVISLILMRDMIDVFWCVTWCMCHMTHSHVSHNPCVLMRHKMYVSYHSFSCVIWCIVYTYNNTLSRMSTMPRSNSITQMYIYKYGK